MVPRGALLLGRVRVQKKRPGCLGASRAFGVRCVGGFEASSYRCKCTSCERSSPAGAGDPRARAQQQQQQATMPFTTSLISGTRDPSQAAGLISSNGERTGLVSRGPTGRAIGDRPRAQAQWASDPYSVANRLKKLVSFHRGRVARSATASTKAV